MIDLDFLSLEISSQKILGVTGTEENLQLVFILAKYFQKNIKLKLLAIWEYYLIKKI